MKKTFILILSIGTILFACSKKKEDNSLRDLSLLGILSSSSGNSNAATFQIEGTLKDSSGNPIANATLTLGVSQNITTRANVTTSTTTDTDGNYTLNLRVGKFSVKVTNSSGVEIGSFSLNATSTTTKPEINVTSGSIAPVVNSVTALTPGEICGKYASSFTTTISFNNTTANGNCSFDSNNFKETCSLFNGTLVTEYNSKYDYVKELTTIGLDTSIKETYTDTNGTCVTTRGYESEGRVVSLNAVKTSGNTPFCTVRSSTYSNYDAKGRPQTETNSSGTITYVYDDTQRKITSSGGCSFFCGTTTFNSNLINISNPVWTTTNIQTTQICAIK